MATKGKRKAVAMSAEELKAQEALTKFTKAHEGKTLTDAQKKEKAELVSDLGKLKFVRIANKRFPRAVAAIRGIKNLSGKSYVKSAAQVEAICTTLENEVKALRDALSGTKAQSAGFVVPGFETDEKK